MHKWGIRASNFKTQGHTAYHVSHLCSFLFEQLEITPKWTDTCSHLGYLRKQLKVTGCMPHLWQLRLQQQQYGIDLDVHQLMTEFKKMNYACMMKYHSATKREWHSGICNIVDAPANARISETSQTRNAKSMDTENIKTVWTSYHLLFIINIDLLTISCEWQNTLSLPH